ncbi:GNAT family N-acetyltransferase [Candidatus Halobonum tyrrellensis]|uniref:GCN5-like N-acetyltransferase n=1 Tax=Candidatus Halobonum tyrrellensis G22 TaxID=1324957 RepID=V4HEX2_9EURY|nr:GNAT family N-acetyltransferase [Candidatus Halobonum tyrrellensis]ESP89255.1 GCN5-like N-acetyltransferase [Candidatus Halobonum tyrrellensis G22]
MTDEPAVRTAEPEDGDRVHELVESAMTVSYALSPDQIETILETEYGEEAFEEKLNDETAVLFVAELDDQVVGVIDGTVDGEGTVRRLHVDPEQRGRGVGTALVERAVSEMHDRGADPLRALVVTANTESGDFLTTFGFARTDEREVDVGGIDLVEEVYTEGAEEADDEAVSDGDVAETSESGSPASDLSDDDAESDEERPSTGDPDDLPDTVTQNGGERYVGDDLLSGTEGPFAPTYEDEAREEAYGYYCGNCGSTDVSVDSMDRLKCADCGNTHQADGEYDGSYL